MTGRPPDAAQLRATVEDLQARNDELQAFTARVSHDLRQPLAVVIGFLDLVTTRFDAELPPTVQTAIRSAGSSAHRMLETVDALRRHAAAGAPARHEAVPLADVVAGAVADLLGIQGLGTDPAAAGWITVPDPLPSVDTDATLLRLLVQNLLSNAVKFAQPQRSDPSIEVRAEVTDGGWRLHVADNGPGIPPADRERVFDPFVRGATSADLPGDGLGLASARRAAQSLGGELGIEDTPGGGATLVLRVSR